MIICFHKKKLLSGFDERVKIRNPGSVVLQVKVITMWQQIKNHSETPKHMKKLSPLHFLLTHPCDVCELSLSFCLSCLKVYFQTARVSSRSETNSMNPNFCFSLAIYDSRLHNFALELI